MKQKETDFLKALGGIPQSYIDELTQFQAEHAQSPGTARRRPKQRQDEQRKEKYIMMHAADNKNKETGISVRKLRPVTIGILASLTACAVIAAGFGISHFRNDDLDMTPGTAPEQSEMPVNEEIIISETEIVQEEISETTETEDAAASEIGAVEMVLSFFGDNSETGGIPEVPENGAMLFTSMDELRPLLERASDIDLPGKGIQHTESCFDNGQNILLIKTKWLVDSFDSMVRSIYVTADGYLHADVASYINDNRDLGLPADLFSHCYLLLAVPDSLSEISGAAVQQTLYMSDNVNGEMDDPFREEMNAYYDDGVYLKQLMYNDADYIFPDFAFEMYAPDEDMEDDSSWMLGSMLVNMKGAGLPEQIASRALEIIEPNLTQLNENTLVGINNVQGGAAPYISVYDTADGTARRLVYPDQKYAGTLSTGMRVTLLSTAALADTAEMQAPIEEPAGIDSALPHTDGHASFLTIVNNP